MLAFGNKTERKKNCRRTKKKKTDERGKNLRHTFTHEVKQQPAHSTNVKLLHRHSRLEFCFSPSSVCVQERESVHNFAFVHIALLFVQKKKTAVAATTTTTEKKRHSM